MESINAFGFEWKTSFAIAKALKMYPKQTLLDAWRGVCRRAMESSCLLSMRMMMGRFAVLDFLNCMVSIGNFIRNCIGLENVSDADLARCMAWELRKRNGKQLFGVYEDVYGTVHGGGF